MAGDLEICSVFHPGNFGCIPGNTYSSDGYTGNFYGLNYISHGSLLQLFSGSHGKLASSLLKSSGANHMTIICIYCSFPKLLGSEAHKIISKGILQSDCLRPWLWPWHCRKSSRQSVAGSLEALSALSVVCVFLQIQLEHLKLFYYGAQRDGSVVKITSCSSRGPEFTSQAKLKWGLTILCNLSSKGSNALLQPLQAPGMNIMHRYTCRQNTYRHKKTESSSVN